MEILLNQPIFTEFRPSGKPGCFAVEEILQNRHGSRKGLRRLSSFLHDIPYQGKNKKRFYFPRV